MKINVAQDLAERPRYRNVRIGACFRTSAESPVFMKTAVGDVVLSNGLVSARCDPDALVYVYEAELNLTLKGFANEY